MNCPHSQAGACKFCYWAARAKIDTLEKENERLTEVCGKMKNSVELYRSSHNFCIKDKPQGLCNKCQYAEEALALPKPLDELGEKEKV